MNWEKVTRSNFLIKLKSWEYWPFGIVQFPAILYWLWLSVRARSFVFFSASNPGIPMGGMFGESKYDILKQISPIYVPRTLLVSLPSSVAEIMGQIKQAGMQLPLIFKPDIGERGFMVKRIDRESDIENYLAKTKVRFLIQDLVQLPLEFGVFYMKLPTERKGRVISLIGKEMLTVTGDGRSTLQELILRNDRAKLQWQRIRETHREQLSEVVSEGHKVEVVSIGNHAMGTRFIDLNHLINERLSASFEKISNEVDGFYFGRFDLRCASLDDLYDGKVKIMELNGCGAEPAHIYDTEFSLLKALGVLITHWQRIYQIARANNENGVEYVSHREAFSSYRKFKAVVK
jgi:hypothetical protein